MLPQVDWNSPREMGRNPPFFPVGTQWETCGKNRRQGLGKKGFAQKKVLSLVLCVAMLLSVMVMGTGAVTLTDSEDISPQYREAAEVLTGMGIINGYEDDSFKPQQSIKRSEVATMIYRAATGDVTNSEVGMYVDYDKFTDVESDDWFAGYVNFCGNAELIKGYEDDSFGPERNVTGYEVLAMILRAVGYDQNNEFTGADWAIKVASTAQSLGILKNVQEATLGQAATRELVAELIFQAMNVKVVDYTPALGYKPLWYTLGEQEFKLKCKDGTADVWGRPSDTWSYNTGDKETVIEQAAVYTNTVKVDECDIAEALGLTKAANIESAYIDGVKTPVKDSAVASDRGGDIDPLDTTSLVGAQGRQLEVYDMGKDGYRIVEINTYLAQVDKVTPSITDKNGHTTTATVDLDAFLTKDAPSVDIKGVAATGFSVGDYVLVQVYLPNSYNREVQSIELAPITVGGTLTGWTNASGTTPATSTVGGETYNDADKFFLNNRKSDHVWNVITDDYGNVIGLVKATTNYLVVEAVRWIGDSTLYGGHAVADVVLANGERVSNVTIASVNGTAANHHSVAAGNPANASFDTSYADNSDYYNHIWSYAVNADGTYALGENNKHTSNGVAGSVVNSNDLTGATITKGQTIMSGTNSGSTKSVAINDSTVFVVKDTDGYTYTTYVGKENVPSMTGAEVCYITEGNYATFVVVTDYALKSNTFAAYVDVDAAATGRQTNLGYAFNVYKVGEPTPTTVYYGQPTLPLNFGNDGMYKFTVNDKMQLVDNNGNAYGEAGAGTIQGTIIMDVLLNGMTPDTGTQPAFDGFTWDRNYIKSNDGNNMYVADNNTDTYWVDNAQYILVSYDNAGKMTGIRSVNYSDVTWNENMQQQVLVAYKTVNNVKQAAYVYVIDVAGSATDDTPTTSDISVSVDGMQTGKNVKDATFAVKGTYTDNGTQKVDVPVTNVVWYRLSTDGTKWEACNDASVFNNGTYRAEITVSAPANGVVLGEKLSDGSALNANVTWNSANTISYQFTY